MIHVSPSSADYGRSQDFDYRYRGDCDVYYYVKWTDQQIVLVKLSRQKKTSSKSRGVE